MFNINRHQQQSVLAIGQAIGGDFLVAFGSQLTGATHQTSDLDIGYFSNQKLDYKQEYSLTNQLQKVFPNHKVDLINLGTASPLLQHRACFGGKLLAEVSPHSFAKFQMTAYLKYLETRPLRKLRQQFLAQTTGTP